MSFASKITLGASICTAVGIIYYVQAKQQDDIRKMHEGVLRDKDRQRMRKIENTYIIEQQAQVTKMLQNQKSNNAAVKILLEDDGEAGK